MLSKSFTAKELGNARFVLSVQVDYDRDHGMMQISQQQFIDRLVNKFGQKAAHSVNNPSSSSDLHQSPGSQHSERKSCRELVGSLLYVASATRPDICAAVEGLVQQLDEPLRAHWNAALRVVRYLKGTASLGITFARANETSWFPSANVDANRGGDVRTRRSTSGSLVFLGGGPVVFKSKRQATVALSSTEAECMALSLCLQDVLWLRHLLSEILGLKFPPTIVRIDNQAAIAMAKHRGYQSRAKHIDLRHHFVQDAVERQDIALQYVPTSGQTAGFMTKALPTAQFINLRKTAGIRDGPNQS